MSPLVLVRRHADDVTRDPDATRRQQDAGAAIERRRQQLGWTQRRLSEESGVGLRTLTDIEAGRRLPRPSSAEKLDRALGWKAGSVARLYVDGAPPELDDVLADTVDDRLRELYKAINNPILSPEVRDGLRRRLDVLIDQIAHEVGFWTDHATERKTTESNGRGNDG